jgi:hypothetical protein
MGGIKFKANGPLFSRERRSILKPAIKSTLEYGKSVIQDNTPVLTGNLRRRWAYETRSNSIYNLAPYAEFVENGTKHFAARGMIARSVGQIEDFFIKAVEQEIAKLGV